MQFKIYDIQICGQSGYCFTDEHDPQFAVLTEGGAADWIRITVAHGGQTDWEQEFPGGYYFRYAGNALRPKIRYQLSVQAQKGGQCARADASFDTGFLGGPWEGTWIEPVQERAVPEPEIQFYQVFRPEFWGTLDETKLRPAQVLSRQFTLDAVPDEAVLYASAHGVYDVKINGRSPDERRLAPEVSAYQKNLYYQRYDLAPFLHPGENRLEFILADGWWIGRIGLVGSSCQYGDALGLIAQLELTQDGRTTVLGTDESFLGAESEIRYADLFIGEKWDRTFAGGRERPCRTADYPTDNLFAQSLAPIRVTQTLPGRLFRTPKGDLLADFGQTLAGVVRADFAAQGKRTITLEHCEVLDKHGEFYQNIVGRNKQQMDTLICGAWPCTFEPRFTYHGFRYVRLTGVTEEEIVSIQAQVIQSPIRFWGEFNCSDERLNRLQQNIQWSMRGNFVSIPTDCPQREKLGWTGDIVSFARTALFNADVRGFLENWLRNMRMEQRKNGEIPNYVPNFPINDRIQRKSMGDNTSAAWGDACVLIPWNLYELTGDLRVLEENLPMMERWLKFIDAAIQVMPEEYETFDREKKERYRYLWHSGHHYGDWLIPSFMDQKDGMQRGMQATSEIVSSAFYAVTLRAYIQVLTALQTQEPSGRYTAKLQAAKARLQKVKAAVRAEYVQPDGRIPGDLQGLYVIILYAEITGGELKQKVARQLVELIRRDGDRLNTGFVTTPYLLHVLSENGYSDVAWMLLRREQAPSWLYQVARGATTIWESWEAITGDGEVTTSSFNHYALGCVGDWIYQYLGGIRAVDLERGRVLFAPDAGSGLTHAAASVQKPFGRVACSWHREEDAMVIRVQSPVPFCLQAGGTSVEYGAGEYVFRCCGDTLRRLDCET